jgi:predicted nicotinamide N-methyase
MAGDAVQETVRVGGLALQLVRPRDPEDLIDEQAFAEDEFLPYWAELWPSALALADAVGRAGGGLAGQRVIELGCGLGLPSLAAAAAGARRVVATDWSAEAVHSVDSNARRNRLAIETAVWRWTDDPAALGGPFDLVLAADVLYERRNGPWVLSALAGLLAVDGEAWIAEPGRSTAEPFLAAAAERYAIDRLVHSGPASVTVHRLRAR